MRIVTTRWFHRWARAEGLTQADLIRVATEFTDGLKGAHLRGELYKKRLARPGHGKRGGYRVFLAEGRDRTFFFVFGLAKSDRENIERTEVDALRLLVAQLVRLQAFELASALRQQRLIEGIHDA